MIPEIINILKQIIPIPFALMHLFLIFLNINYQLSTNLGSEINY